MRIISILNALSNALHLIDKSSLFSSTAFLALIFIVFTLSNAFHPINKSSLFSSTAFLALIFIVFNFFLSYGKKGKTSKSLKINFRPENITLNSLSGSVTYIITLLPVSSIYMPAQWFNIVNILNFILLII